MESVLGNYTDGANFWKLYPSYKAPAIYKKLYNGDKSKGKSTSSNLMWALHFLFDKSDSNMYRNLDKDERFELIAEDILDDYDYDWNKKKDLVEFSEKIMLTEVEKTYYAYIEFMERRRQLIEKEQEDMSLDNVKDLDDAIKRNKDNLAELSRLEGLVKNQSEDGVTKGSIIESARERGLF